MAATLSFSCGTAVLLGEVQAGAPLIVLPSAPEEAEAARALAGDPAIVALDVDWDRYLSPWPAAGVFRGQHFTGEAPALLRAVLEEVLPWAEAGRPVIRCVAGYSLAGLFALWAARSCTAFARAASMSGSLWYEGWADFADSHPCRAGRVYLSLGDREGRTRNPRMRAIPEATEQERLRLLREGCEVTFHPEPGGHFDDVAGRMARGMGAQLGGNHPNKLE